MDITCLILPKCSQASSKSNCTQLHLPFSSLFNSLSGYRYLFALLPCLVDYPILTNPSFPLHPFLLFLVSPVSLLLS